MVNGIYYGDNNSERLYLVCVYAGRFQLRF